MGTGTAVTTGDTVTAAKMNLKLESIVNADVEAGAAIADSKINPVPSTALTTHGNLTNPHSATAAATASRIILRDAAGRAAVVAPSASTDIALKSTVTDDIVTHAVLTAVHGATGALIPSNPTGGNKKVTNIYYDPTDGQIKYEVEP